MLDSLMILSDSILTDTISQVKQITESDNVDFISKLSDSPLVLKILLPIILMFIGWLLKLLFDKYIAIRPRLYLKLGKPLYRQRMLGYDIGHQLTWVFECSVKNNSKFDAYDIEFLEYKPSSDARKIITNRQELTRVFTPNNHISSNCNLEFEIKKTIKTNPETLIKFEKQGAETVIIPGLKIANPQKALMPSELKNIRLVIKYNNEKGKTFYTKFTRQNNNETNRIKSIKPWFIHGLNK